jgi:formate hydrogenlyase subunit 3/multisubunit Na+/H+ antiporter MnhD subunit
MLFASEFLLVTSVGRQMPWLLLPLLLGLLVGAAALVRTAQRLCLGPATPDAPGAPQPGLLVLLPLWGLLLLAMWGMLAMPGPIAAMLRAAAEVPG